MRFRQPAVPPVERAQDPAVLVHEEQDPLAAKAIRFQGDVPGTGHREMAAIRRFHRPFDFVSNAECVEIVP